MTNTKFRKRALLSSVAMLLVALVALGSATFAWFAENPVASASGIKLKTTAAAGLDIKSESQNTWGKQAVLNAATTGASATSKTTGFDLTPASQGQNTTDNSVVTGHASAFNTIEANAPNASAAKNASGVVFKSITGGLGSTGVYAETVSFKLSDGADSTKSRDVLLKGVTINSVSGAKLAGAIRVSIADANNVLVGTYALNTAKDNKTVPYDATNKTFGVAGAGVDYSPSLVKTLESGSKYVPSTDITVATGIKTTAANAKDIKVYVYLDGQDTDCYTTNVGTVDVDAIISSIDLEFALAAES